MLQDLDPQHQPINETNNNSYNIKINSKKNKKTNSNNKNKATNNNNKTTSNKHSNNNKTTSNKHIINNKTTSNKHSNNNKTTSNPHSNNNKTTSNKHIINNKTTSNNHNKKITSNKHNINNKTTSNPHSNNNKTTSNNHSNKTTSNKHSNNNKTTSINDLSCLQLITDCPPSIQEELDLISALSRLEDFGVKVLPLQVRLRDDRLSLIKECIAQCSTAYKQSNLLLQLARLLRVSGDDVSQRKGQVLTLLAEQALHNHDYKASYIHCQDLMAAGMFKLNHLQLKRF
ncbi:NBAS subunit of NRZ tethering complex isoform X1 [Tachysurus ichikawai]